VLIARDSLNIHMFGMGICTLNVAHLSKNTGPKTTSHVYCCSGKSVYIITYCNYNVHEKELAVVYVVHHLSLLFTYFLWLFSLSAFLWDQCSTVPWACIQPIAIGMVLAESVFISLCLWAFVTFEVAAIIKDTTLLTAWDYAGLRNEICSAGWEYDCFYSDLKYLCLPHVQTLLHHQM